LKLAEKQRFTSRLIEDHVTPDLLSLAQKTKSTSSLIPSLTQGSSVARLSRDWRTSGVPDATRVRVADITYAEQLPHGSAGYAALVMSDVWPEIHKLIAK
jgi:hypothetical protein